MVVEDDEHVRHALQEVLSLCGVDVTLAADGMGLACIEEHPEPFDVAIIDVRMPGMDGVQLVENLTGANRPGRIVLVSGDEPRGRIDALGSNDVEFMRKPLDLARLCRALGLQLPRSML